MAEIKQLRCARCGKLFSPEKDYYRYCPGCQAERLPDGWSATQRRRDTSDRRYGGKWRTAADVRPVVLRGDITTRQILESFRTFLEDLYHRPAGLSSLLMKTGFDRQELKSLNQNKLNDLVMRFLPAFRQWLMETVGFRATELIIEHYGLYGDPRVTLSQMAESLGLDGEEHAQNLLGWALRQLREPEHKATLENLAAKIARSLQ